MRWGTQELERKRGQIKQNIEPISYSKNPYWQHCIKPEGCIGEAKNPNWQHCIKPNGCLGKPGIGGPRKYNT